MSTADTVFVKRISETLALHGIDCYVAERDLKPGALLANKLRDAIRNCDCVVALLTNDGSQSAYVHQEIGVATALDKPMIPVVEKGVVHGGLKGMDRT